MIRRIFATEVKPSEVAGFRSIFKATSIFGGVQIFNIIISLVRGKVLAVLIGSAGMGINGLFVSSMNLITTISGLGITESAIRDISEANHSGKQFKIRHVYSVFKRWIWLTAFIGFLLTISFSPVLSIMTFGDWNHTTSYLLLSCTFIFGALTGGIQTLLRGLRKIKDLALSNIIGSAAGLIVAIPIFYFFKIQGIVPALITTSMVAYIVSIYFRRKVQIEKIDLTWKETFRHGKKMAGMGIVLIASSLLTSAGIFILNAYISRKGSLEELGIYSAGQSIIVGYVDLVFVAMSKDYYPRLSEVINFPEQWKRIANQQSETVLLILGPILSFIFLSAPILIKILLSEAFLPALDFILWASLGIIFKGIAWTSGFILISKRDNKIFFYVQAAAQIWSLFFNILLFNYFGVKGLGISMTINGLISVLVMFFILKGRYNFILSRSTYKLALTFLFLLAISLTVNMLVKFPNTYYFVFIIFAISMSISIYGLNKRMNLLSLIHGYFFK